MTPLKQYEAAYEAYKAFQEANKETIEQYEKLLSDLNQKQDTLKKFAWDAKDSDLVSDMVSVSVARPIKRWYDYETVMTNATEEEKDLILALCVNKKIDCDALNALVLSGDVSGDVTAQALQEEEQTPRVTIKLK